ncbi:MULTISPECIES: PLP-dependent aminotransferase family protein [Methylobacterium]|uniref:8-amino-7-oxononanoate synthase n=1 Tax=Methylobacterium bullatum TaxID=570505 RepID=A0AAV4ZDY3_9HYPH|nr:MULTISPECIES: PLP-dependent aminotransferase family protein [Methylobacterium]KQO43576.1 GntR family transcriptional regulator [Methylobacterium sp. Leaf85]MBD8903559.1 PLP-dependent aminotransferase family protein [Methylobacterium bullatum]TXN27915.1 PLP-dependent aminotransferase family protein [Methylobacterium sp. WL19]GJD42030.1 Histidinol-phosphate aminotransferase [Methylobacterium bullatum]
MAIGRGSRKPGRSAGPTTSPSPPPDGWTPDLGRWGKPHYLAIAEAIADDIRTGRLAVAERLPPQRALAERLELNFTTVARGYVEAQRRGLVEARVGQGTFVAGPAMPVPALRIMAPRRHGPVDFTMNLPPEPDDPALLARMQGGLASVSEDLPNLLRYQGFGGTPEDKDAAIEWLRRRGLEASRDRLLICPGAHAAIGAVMSLVAQPGDTICCETLTYPGARALAAHLGMRLVGLPMDAEGIDAAAFAATCTRHAPKALYLNPTLQNPTTITISPARRADIVTVARRYNVAIIEDDAYGFVPVTPATSFYQLAPEITYHVAGLAKCLGAGLRLAYMLAPSARAALQLTAALRASTVMASPITTALATRWIGDGTAEAILAFVRSESRVRQGIATGMLGRHGATADPAGFHLWLSLPEGWTRSAFASQARAAGIGAVASDAFLAAGEAPEAVRICLGGLAGRAEIAQSLEILAHALSHSPALASAYI